jgi:cyclase
VRRRSHNPAHGVWLTWLIAIPLAVCFWSPAHAQEPQIDDDPFYVWPVQGNVYILVGAGGNITLSVGRDGVLMVDTGVADMTDSVLARIQELSRELDPNGPTRPIRYIVNTHLDEEHMGGNSGIVESDFFRPLAGGEEVIAHDNIVLRMIDADERPAPSAVPTHTYRTEQHRVNRFFNGEGVQVIHIPAAHTDGDSIVYFRYSDVISTGDIIAIDRYPVIDLEQGGSIQGLLDGISRIIDLMFPEFRSQGGTMVVPGHGRICDLTEVAYYRDMVTIIRDRIRNAIEKGMTLEEVKAARLTLDFDPVYGREPGATDRFVESVYRSLIAGQ